VSGAWRRSLCVGERSGLGACRLHYDQRMIVVRALWTVAALLAIAAGALYISDPSTTGWYLYFAGAAPLVLLIALRVFAIQKRNPDSKVDPGGAHAPALMEPPP